MYLDILENGKVIKRIDTLLNTLSFSNELMYIPTLSIVLPMYYKEYLGGRPEIKIYTNNKVFYGLVKSFDLDTISETISLTMDHIIQEWTYRQIGTNIAIKDKMMKEVYATKGFKYSNEWDIVFHDNAGEQMIDYVYSCQNMLEGLTQTIELTPDLFWRVHFSEAKVIEVGTFGEEKPYIFSLRPSTKRNIRIISEPTITESFENVINKAIVYSEKSDTGMSSMSLREVFMHKERQDSHFPVYQHEDTINNERDYHYENYATLAPNNSIEYFVLDTESIAIEGGTIIEGTFAFDDISPFSTEGKEIEDDDRVTAAVTAYHAAIKELKNARREYSITLTTEEIPGDLYVGDKVRLVYHNDFFSLEECSNYLKKILLLDNWFHITAIDYQIDKNGVETNTIKLDKYIRIDRESA